MKTRLLSSIIVLAAVLAFAFGGMPGMGAESAQAGGMMQSKTGDLNMDGTANSLDALIVLFYDAGLTEPPEDIDAWTIMADVDCDLVVTALDAAFILQADAGLYEMRT